MRRRCLLAKNASPPTPGPSAEWERARADLVKLQLLLERQRQGLRRVKPLTLSSVKRRVRKALAREHMESLFTVEFAQGVLAPTLTFVESKTPGSIWMVTFWAAPCSSPTGLTGHPSRS